MSNVLAIARKEIKVYFTTSIAYAVIGLFLFVSGYFFRQLVAFFMQLSVQYLKFNQPQMLDQLNVTDMIARPVVLNMGVVMIFFIPALTMRLLAEEQKQRTIELLLTAPISLWDIVLGKYLAALFIVFVMVATTLTYPLLIHLATVEGGGVAWTTVLSAYGGLFLAGAVFVSVGMFCSAVTENQIVAAILSLAALLLLWVLNWAASQAEGVTADVLTHISLLDHLQNFSKGLIELKSLVYYIGFAFFGLFLTHKVLETQRYAGA